MIKTFVKKSIVYLCLSFLFLVAYVTIYTTITKNIADPFYVKLLNTTENGLIIGDSRALQGVDPGFLDFPTENFAFTIGHSPFDGSYLKLIKKKLSNTTNKERHHIVCVSPWALLNIQGNDKNPYFSENLKMGFCSPNYEYIFKYWDLSFVSSASLIVNKSFTTNRGWLNLNVDSYELDKEYSRRVKEKIENYEMKYRNMTLSDSSKWIENFCEIVGFLQKSGTVHIVRLPVSQEMLNLENRQFPNFINIINNVSNELKASFVDLTDFNVKTTDGNHIWNQEVPRLMGELNNRLKHPLRSSM